MTSPRVPFRIETTGQLDHEPGPRRRVLAAGRVEGGVVFLRALAGDHERAAVIEALRRSGRAAWHVRPGQEAS